MDKIINGIDGQTIELSVAQFTYKGWLVSFSQVFKPSSVAIFKGETEVYNLPNVEAAIKKINDIESIINDSINQ